MVGFGKSRIDLFGIAKRVRQANIVRRFIINNRGARLYRICSFNDRRQQLDVDHNRFGRIACLCFCLRNDASQRIADKTHLVL